MRENPFGSRLARAHSNLHFCKAGRLVAVEQKAKKAQPFLDQAHAAFRALVTDPAFSCLGAKAAFNEEAYAFAVYEEMGAPASTAGLSRDLCQFARSEILMRNEYATFVSVFERPRQTGEEEFEKTLWQQLRNLHRADMKHFGWDGTVASDPEAADFSFSFTGRAFYVLGMHPDSSRVARRFPWPALVFNPHEQFERLRTDGKWKRMQRSIRRREIALQGSVNPMLTNFGIESEARQYSGRVVAQDWQAPFPERQKSPGQCPFAHSHSGAEEKRA